MLREALRYPVATPSGRRGVLVLAASVLGIAVGSRYAIALWPSVLALLPIVFAGAVFTFVIGIASVELASGDAAHPRPSLPGVLRRGVTGTVVAVAYLALPVCLLFLTAIGASDAVASGADASSGFTVAFLLAATVALGTVLVAGYALPTALVAVDREGLRGGIGTGLTSPALRSLPYLLGWVTGFVLIGLGGGVALVTIGSTDVVGLASSVLAAALALAGVRAIAIGHARALE